MDFLPNSDAVVYVVSYRDGFQEADYEFLKELLELVRPGAPIYLMINRCPQGVTIADRRVCEIFNNVKALLQQNDIPIFLTESFANDNMTQYNMQIDSFVNTVKRDLRSEKRINELQDAFGEFINDLILQVQSEIERLISIKQSTREEIEFQNKSLQDLIDKLNNADNEIIKPGFQIIRSRFPCRVEWAREKIESETVEHIDEQSKTCSCLGK